MKPGSCEEDVCLRCSNKCVLLQSKGLGGQRVTHTVAGNFSFSSDHMSQLHGLTHVAREIGNFHLDRNSFCFFNWRMIALQCCVGFCLTTTRISHNYIYVSPSSRASFPPIHIYFSIFFLPQARITTDVAQNNCIPSFSFFHYTGF